MAFFNFLRTALNIATIVAQFLAAILASYSATQADTAGA